MLWVQSEHLSFRGSPPMIDAIAPSLNLRVGCRTQFRQAGVGHTHRRITVFISASSIVQFASEKAVEITVLELTESKPLCQTAVS